MSALSNIGKRILESVEQRTGREIVAAGTTEILESTQGTQRVIDKTLEFIGWKLLSMQSGVSQLGRMPVDVPHTSRVIAAAQSDRAWMEDPVAGQQVDLYVSFVGGRGVPNAVAHDDEVQNVLDVCWADAANQRILTSDEAFIEKLIDMCVQSNVYFKFHDDGEDGMVRVSLASFEDVIDVVRHPRDKYRILFYKAIERQERYDFRQHMYVSAGEPKTVYYEAWGAFDDDNPVMVKQDEDAGGRAALTPNASMLRPGKIVHKAVNKRTDMAFGMPRMRRLIRWMTAHNEMLEGHVNRMKAMASLYMKYTAQGASDRELDKLGRMAVAARPSLLGQSQDVPVASAHLPGPSFGQTGVVGTNEALKIEPFKIDSGATDVAASMPVMRSQVSGIFPPSYYGQDAGSLAGAQSVELPVLKAVEREQSLWTGLLRTLGQAAIDAAIRVGDLDEWRDATVDELAQIDAAERSGQPTSFEVGPDGRIRRDLSFEVNLPSPLKRLMGDLVTAAVATAAAVDPTGANPEMSRWLFGFILKEAFDVEDAQSIVDQVLPRHVAQSMAAVAAAAAGGMEIDPVTGQPRPVAPADAATSTGADGKQHTAANPHGAKLNVPPPEKRTVKQSAAVPARRVRALGAAFDEDVVRVTERVLERLGQVSANGGGG